jgi:DNA polymerase III epsilon subunit-like protein
VDNEPKILVVDIETKLIDVRAFGIRDQYLDIKQIVNIPKSARTIHCIGWKWLGERKAHVLSEWEHGYEGMIVGIRDKLDEADAVLGFNHINFDMKKMKGQFALLGLDLPKPPTNIDIFKTVRQMGFPSSKLDYIAQAFGIGRKVKHPGFEMWADCLDGCPKAQRKMALYCAGDVRLTEQVYERLLPYLDNYPHLRERSGHACAKCGSTNLTSQGWKRTVHYRVQSLKCENGHWSQGKREKVA